MAGGKNKKKAMVVEDTPALQPLTLGGHNIGKPDKKDRFSKNVGATKHEKILRPKKLLKIKAWFGSRHSTYKNRGGQHLTSPSRVSSWDKDKATASSLNKFHMHEEHGATSHLKDICPEEVDLKLLETVSSKAAAVCDSSSVKTSIPSTEALTSADDVRVKFPSSGPLQSGNPNRPILNIPTFKKEKDSVGDRAWKSALISTPLDNGQLIPVLKVSENIVVTHSDIPKVLLSGPHFEDKTVLKVPLDDLTGLSHKLCAQCRSDLRVSGLAKIRECACQDFSRQTKVVLKRLNEFEYTVVSDRVSKDGHANVANANSAPDVGTEKDRDLNGNIKTAQGHSLKGNTDAAREDIGKGSRNNSYLKTNLTHNHSPSRAEQNFQTAPMREAVNLPPLKISRGRTALLEEDDDDKTPEYPLKEGSFFMTSAAEWERQVTPSKDGRTVETTRNVFSEMYTSLSNMRPSGDETVQLAVKKDVLKTNDCPQKLIGRPMHDSDCNAKTRACSEKTMKLLKNSLNLSFRSPKKSSVQQSPKGNTVSKKFKDNGTGKKQEGYADIRACVKKVDQELRCKESRSGNDDGYDSSDQIPYLSPVKESSEHFMLPSPLCPSQPPVLDNIYSERSNVGDHIEQREFENISRTVQEVERQGVRAEETSEKGAGVAASVDANTELIKHKSSGQQGVIRTASVTEFSTACAETENNFNDSDINHKDLPLPEVCNLAGQQEVKTFQKSIKHDVPNVMPNVDEETPTSLPDNVSGFPSLTASTEKSSSVGLDGTNDTEKTKAQLSAVIACEKPQSQTKCTAVGVTVQTHSDKSETETDIRHEDSDGATVSQSTPSRVVEKLVLDRLQDNLGHATTSCSKTPLHVPLNISIPHQHSPSLTGTSIGAPKSTASTVPGFSKSRALQNPPTSNTSTQQTNCHHPNGRYVTTTQSNITATHNAGIIPGLYQVSTVSDSSSPVYSQTGDQTANPGSRKRPCETRSTGKSSAEYWQSDCNKNATTQRPSGVDFSLPCRTGDKTNQSATNTSTDQSIMNHTVAGTYPRSLATETELHPSFHLETNCNAKPNFMQALASTVVPIPWQKNALTKPWANQGAHPRFCTTPINGMRTNLLRPFAPHAITQSQGHQGHPFGHGVDNSVLRMEHSPIHAASGNSSVSHHLFRAQKNTGQASRATPIWPPPLLFVPPPSKTGMPSLAQLHDRSQLMHVSVPQQKSVSHVSPDVEPMRYPKWVRVPDVNSASSTTKPSSTKTYETKNSNTSQQPRQATGQTMPHENAPVYAISTNNADTCQEFTRNAPVNNDTTQPSTQTQLQGWWQTSLPSSSVTSGDHILPSNGLDTNVRSSSDDTQVGEPLDLSRRIGGGGHHQRPTNTSSASVDLRQAYDIVIQQRATDEFLREQSELRQRHRDVVQPAVQPVPTVPSSSVRSASSRSSRSEKSGSTDSELQGFSIDAAKTKDLQSSSTDREHDAPSPAATSCAVSAAPNQYLSASTEILSTAVPRSTNTSVTVGDSQGSCITANSTQSPADSHSTDVTVSASWAPSLTVPEAVSSVSEQAHFSPSSITSFSPHDTPASKAADNVDTVLLSPLSAYTDFQLSLPVRRNSAYSDISSVSSRSTRLSIDLPEAVEDTASKVVAIPIEDFVTGAPKENSYASLMMAKIQAKNKRTVETINEKDFILSFTQPVGRKEFCFEINNSLQKSAVIDLTEDDDCDVVSVSSKESVGYDDDDNDIRSDFLDMSSRDKVPTPASMTAMSAISDAVTTQLEDANLRSSLSTLAGTTNANFDPRRHSGDLDTIVDKSNTSPNTTVQNSEVVNTVNNKASHDSSLSPECASPRQSPNSSDHCERLTFTGNVLDLREKTRTGNHGLEINIQQHAGCNGSVSNKENTAQRKNLKIDAPSKEMLSSRLREVVATRLSQDERVRLDIPSGHNVALGEATSHCPGVTSTQAASRPNIIGRPTDDRYGSSAQREAATFLALSTDPLYSSVQVNPETSGAFQEKVFQIHPTLSDNDANRISHVSEQALASSKHGAQGIKPGKVPSRHSSKRGRLSSSGSHGSHNFDVADNAALAVVAAAPNFPASAQGYTSASSTETTVTSFYPTRPPLLHCPSLPPHHSHPPQPSHPPPFPVPHRLLPSCLTHPSRQPHQPFPVHQPNPSHHTLLPLVPKLGHIRGELHAPHTSENHHLTYLTGAGPLDTRVVQLMQLRQHAPKQVEQIPTHLSTSSVSPATESMRYPAVSLATEPTGHLNNITMANEHLNAASKNAQKADCNNTGPPVSSAESTNMSVVRPGDNVTHYTVPTCQQPMTCFNITNQDNRPSGPRPNGDVIPPLLPCPQGNVNAKDVPISGKNDTVTLAIMLKPDGTTVFQPLPSGTTLIPASVPFIYTQVPPKCMPVQITSVLTTPQIYTPNSITGTPANVDVSPHHHRKRKLLSGEDATPKAVISSEGHDAIPTEIGTSEKRASSISEVSSLETDAHAKKKTRKQKQTGQTAAATKDKNDNDIPTRAKRSRRSGGQSRRKARSTKGSRAEIDDVIHEFNASCEVRTLNRERVVAQTSHEDGLVVLSLKSLENEPDGEDQRDGIDKEQDIPSAKGRRTKQSNSRSIKTVNNSNANTSLKQNYAPSGESLCLGDGESVTRSAVQTFQAAQCLLTMRDNDGGTGSYQKQLGGARDEISVHQDHGGSRSFSSDHSDIEREVTSLLASLMQNKLLREPVK